MQSQHCLSIEMTSILHCILVVASALFTWVKLIFALYNAGSAAAEEAEWCKHLASLASVLVVARDDMAWICDAGLARPLNKDCPDTCAVLSGLLLD